MIFLNALKNCIIIYLICIVHVKVHVVVIASCIHRDVADFN